MYMKLESKIGELINERGLKRKWIAEKVGVTPKQISNWVTGYSYPTVEKAFKLANLLGVKVDDLYEIKKEPTD
jgi:putative transcriptional regulator